MRRHPVCFFAASFAAIASVSVAQDVPTIDDTLAYRMANAGYERLNETMCADIVNGGDLDNQLQMQPCGNYSGQIWYFTQKVTELRHLPTYTMATEFRGRDMCLTIDGNLIEHVLRLLPCSDVPTPHQLWVVMPAESTAEGAGPETAVGWQIMPLLDQYENDEDGFSLVVSTPPHGDGVPYIDWINFVGDGYIWRLIPWQ